jgi:Ca2+-binding RTX toxin-like protein
VGRAALLTLALALVGASPAVAADVWVTVVRDDEFSFALIDLHGAPGEANAVTVTGGYGAVVVHDGGAPLHAGPGCRSLGTHHAECHSKGPPLNGARVFGEDGNDALADAAPGVNTRFYGGPGDDVLRGDDDPQSYDGGDGADQVFAGASHDELKGGPGADLLHGGDSFDHIYGDPAGRDAWPDVLDGGPGEDLVSYRGREGGVQIDLASTGSQGAPGEGDRLTGFERAEGGTGRDVILGDDGPNLLETGDARRGPGDVLDGRGGDDRLHGSFGDDLLEGGLGDDRLDGGGGSDTYSGGPGDDGLSLDLAPFNDPQDKDRARVTCGPGNDVAYAADWRVLMPRDCEVIAFELMDLRIRRAGARQLALTSDEDRSVFGCVTVTVSRPGAARPFAQRAVRIGNDPQFAPVLRWRRPRAGRVIVRLRGTSRCRPRGGYRIGAFTLILPPP